MAERKVGKTVDEKVEKSEFLTGSQTAAEWVVQLVAMRVLTMVVLRAA